MTTKERTRPKKPPAFPKEQERRQFEDIIAGLKNMAKADERTLEQMKGLFDAMESIESDGNVRTRWETYVKVLPDFTLKEAEMLRAKCEVIQEKLTGEYTGKLEAEDIAGMKRTELDELAKEQFGVEDPSIFKKVGDLRAHLLEQMKADEEQE